MAFEFSKKLFSRTPAAQVEQSEQGIDVIKKLESYQQDALHNIKVKHKDGLAFSESDNSEFGVIRLELAEKVGQDIAETAIKEYMKADLPSRVDNLKGLLERQPVLRTKLFESLAQAMNPVNSDAVAALEEVKAFIKVANARHFSDQDINQLCDVIIASAEFEAYQKAKEEAIIASVKDGSASGTKNEIFKSPYAGDAPRHIASQDSIHPADDTEIDWKTHTEEFQPEKPPRETL